MQIEQDLLEQLEAAVAGCRNQSAFEVGDDGHTHVVTATAGQLMAIGRLFRVAAKLADHFRIRGLAELEEVRGSEELDDGC